ncbi:MAG: hypothetical protein DMF49_07645 [Acidobacteria bacterium]|nr:MAG: hypothetical protein DMF49_07645 [Acidobacteriota bacterium]
MDESGRTAFRELIEARIAEWERNITNLGHRMAKAKDDPEAKGKVEALKAKLPILAEKAKETPQVSDEGWPDFKSEVDLMFEDMIWMQNYVMRRLGAS